MYMNVFNRRLRSLFAQRIFKAFAPLYIFLYCEDSVIIRFSALLEESCRFWNWQDVVRQGWSSWWVSMVSLFLLVLLNNVLVSLVHSNDMKQYYVMVWYVQNAFCFYLLQCWNSYFCYIEFDINSKQLLRL